MPTATLRRTPLEPADRALRRRIEGLAANLDVVLVGAVAALAVLGVVLVHSATQAAGSGQAADFTRRQTLWVGLGLVVMAAVAAVDHRRIRETAAIWYLGSIALLLVVLSPMGTSGFGSQRWLALGFFRLQPSEVAEVALIVVLAAVCHRYARLGAGHLAAALALTGVPFVLVLAQPNLGSAIVYVVVVFAVTFIGGASARHLALLAVTAVSAAAVAIRMDLLADYQRERFYGFLDPGADAAGAGYNINQSMAAIGSGGLTGRGLGQGSQTQGAWVPSQHTDFVFTVAAEELGFVGAGLVLVLFAVVVWRLWRLAATAQDAFGTLVCVGVLAAVVFKVFQNVGMTMGIMPITGIPLPFLSYGGSATIASFAAIGLALGVGLRRHR